jgi:hypothetical protein
MWIIENGRSPYQILTPGRFYPVEELAARNLQEGLLRMTGVRLPVRWAHQRVAGRPAIVVGSPDAGGEAGLWQKDRYEILPQQNNLGWAARRGEPYTTPSPHSWSLLA